MKQYPYIKDGSVDVHVRLVDDCWEVRRDGRRYISSSHRTRWSAVKAGRLMAEESGSELHIHEHDGCVHIDERVS